MSMPTLSAVQANAQPIIIHAFCSDWATSFKAVVEGLGSARNSASDGGQTALTSQTDGDAKPAAEQPAEPVAKPVPLTQDEILAKVAENEIGVEEAMMLLSELENKPNLYCEVSEKGACSIYGLQRMPVTLYADQWERVLAFAEDLRAFIKEHDRGLRRKSDKQAK